MLLPQTGDVVPAVIVNVKESFAVADVLEQEMITVYVPGLFAATAEVRPPPPLPPVEGGAA